ncbi:hypothetical protein CALVIDRAFT_530567 [Calocera viscosa TUFC12733]|uniref:Uncharacterized protein n=1 Tax=Calocera viscosa (strain TUFC12733) TaxID=1330018 RepID=A0A167HL08_CALVF|nr:hypothetical protein CALVIDRAFT_530567 [Calocera viscosa TUFC12733]
MSDSSSPSSGTLSSPAPIFRTPHSHWGGPGRGPVMPPKRSAAQLACDEEEFYKRKKARADADPLEKLGKHMARTLDLFEAMNPMLEAGLTHEGEDTMFMAEHEPHDTLDVVAKLVEKGRSEARTEDTSKLKGTIYDILKRIFGHDAVKALDRRRKAGRGFHHDLTGRLLTPCEMDWDTDEDRRRLKAGEAGEATSALHFPSFMFGSRYKGSPGHRFKEFMMNDLMLRVALAIFIAPSAATADDVLRSRSNRKGNAELHHMSEMTVPSLAYLALQVRFALSAEETFSKGGQDTFDYSRFYYSVIELLENDLMKTTTARILEWYNARVFPLGKVVEPGLSPTGTAALMLKELEDLAGSSSSEGQ